MKGEIPIVAQVVLALLASNQTGLHFQSRGVFTIGGNASLLELGAGSWELGAEVNPSGAGDVIIKWFMRLVDLPSIWQLTDTQHQ